MAGIIKLDSNIQIEVTAESLTEAVSNAIEQHVPANRPSPYSKRWFTPDMKDSQREVNRTRRRWQPSCAQSGPDHPDTMVLFHEMRRLRRKWTRSIEIAKAKHWKGFLDQAGKGQLWKAASYAGSRASQTGVQTPQVGDREYSENDEKAPMLMDTVFPAVTEPRTSGDTNGRPRRIRWQPLTEGEIYRSNKAAKANTAPREHGIPTLVWQRIWEYVKDAVTPLFSASLRRGYYPHIWKRAKILF